MGVTFSSQVFLSRRHTVERAKTSENEESWEKVFIATSGGNIDREGWPLAPRRMDVDDMKSGLRLLLRKVVRVCSQVCSFYKWSSRVSELMTNSEIKSRSKKGAGGKWQRSSEGEYPLTLILHSVPINPVRLKQ